MKVLSFPICEIRGSGLCFKCVLGSGVLCWVSSQRSPWPCPVFSKISIEPSGSGIELENLCLDHLISLQESKTS